MNKIAGPALAMLFVACTSGGIKPVDIFPEDACAYCRMAFSDHRFASEIIGSGSEVFKFDDIGCMLKFRSDHPELSVAAIYLKNYDTKEWIAFDRAVIVGSSINTPMGSGKVAFADSAKAMEFQDQHPATAAAGATNGCGMDCCTGGKN